MSSQKISFQVETSRVIELLTKQMYQSPLALLRENAQNAFDAILMRRLETDNFSPLIDITITDQQIIIKDNGIGMTAEEIQNNYWYAGSSGKNTAKARAAGVVGTFGVGAMANFGIAEQLIVETESAVKNERSRSKVRREDLRIGTDCIDLELLTARGQPGTEITASIPPENRINVEEAQKYISNFLHMLDIPVCINGILVSQKSAETLVQKPPVKKEQKMEQVQIGTNLLANVHLIFSQNADVWIKLEKIIWANQPLHGSIILRSGTSALNTFRSGFGLAVVTTNSHYQFGGVIDLRNLEPTAGREALTTSSMQFIQSLILQIEPFISEHLSKQKECNSSNLFISWVVRNSRYELCDNLSIKINPGDEKFLGEIKEDSKQKTFSLYSGNDPSIIQQYSQEDNPLLLLAQNNPRRTCQDNYLEKFCRAEKIQNAATILEKKSDENLSLEEKAFIYRVESTIKNDYFLKVRVVFGRISHNLPILINDQKNDEIEIVLDSSEEQSVALILALYEQEFSAFGGMVKDFVRNVVYPKISNLVPSSTKQGAEDFLRFLRNKREIFEYETEDLENLSQILEDYKKGNLSIEQALKKSISNQNVQFVESNSSQKINTIMPDIIANQANIGNREQNISLDAKPSIIRTEISSSAKLLLIDPGEELLSGYSCFLAITQRAKEELGDFFLQPHKTSIVWGGQRAMFVFLHHSEEYGLYYDLRADVTLASESGGQPYPTSTIFLRNNIYIPIPDPIKRHFIPTENERKRFEIQYDILRVRKPD